MPNQLDESVKRRAIESLAKEFKQPFDLVAQLYEQERAKLMLGARVTSYLPIFTLRNVQAKLRLLRST
jgi:hypothetical protein